MFKTLFFTNWRNNSVFGAALPAEHNALTLRLWDMTKCLKPYSVFGAALPAEHNACKLKTTQVDWPNSFWDMTKCLKPYFCKLKKQQCIRRSATCWAQRVDIQVDWPNSFWDMTKCLKPYFLQIEETTVYSARRYLLSTTRWLSGRLAK